MNGTLDLAGIFIGGPYPPNEVNGGAIAAQGNVIQGSYGLTGTTVVTISGTGAQTFTGGGVAAHMLPVVINKPSGTLTLASTIATNRDWTYTAGTLDAGTSTLQFFSQNNYSLTLTGSHTLNNVTIGGELRGDVLTIAGGTTLTVNGILDLAGIFIGGPYPPNEVNGGAIAAQGNVIQGSYGLTGTTVVTISGTGAQTFTGGGAAAHMLPVIINKASGTLTLAGTIATESDWTYTAGTLDAGTSTLQFFNGNNQTLTLTGSHTLNNVTIGGELRGDVLTIAGGTTLTVNGTLDLAGIFIGGAYPPNEVNGGAIAAKGNVIQGSYGLTGTTVVTISGTGAQTFTGGGAAAWMLPVVINKPSGTLTLAGTIATGSDWTYTAGTLDAGTSTLQFFTGANQSLTLTGSQTLNNVTIGGAMWNDTLTIAGGTTLTVNGTLNLAETFQGAFPRMQVNGGAIVATGNFVQADLGATGTTAVTISGTGAQTWTSSGGAIPGSVVTVNKASGTLTLGSNVAVNTAGQDLTITAGTIDLAGYNLTVNDILTVAAAGTVQLQGVETITAGTVALNAGSTVLYYGRNIAETLTVKDFGATDYSNLTINDTNVNKATYTIGSALTVAGAFTLSSGTFSQSTQTMNVAGNFALSNGTTFTKATGGQALTLDGTGL